MSEPLVRFESVARRFGAKVVYDGLDLEIARGETLALLGRSGVGKSVMLRLLLGLLKPERGRIFFDGQEITALAERQLAEARRRMGMVFQGSALFDSLSVGENVGYALVEQRWPAARVSARVAECLAMVDLGGSEALRPAVLSGGMRKRVAIARAVAPAPELLLYDEPTAGLDPATSHQVNELVCSLQQRLGMTSIVVTHDLHTVTAVADRIAIVDGGRVTWTGAATAMAEDPAAKQALARFLGRPEEVPWIPPAGSP